MSSTYFIQHTGVSATAAMLRIALVSVTCVLVVMSVYIFITGLFVVTTLVKDGESQLIRTNNQLLRTLKLWSQT